jgi:hypothetical protein
VERVTPSKMPGRRGDRRAEPERSEQDKALNWPSVGTRSFVQPPKRGPTIGRAHELRARARPPTRSIGMNKSMSSHGILKHQAFETEALYRVIDVANRLVAVEVITAPGLARGTRFQITRRAARRMNYTPADSVALADLSSWQDTPVLAFA